MHVKAKQKTMIKVDILPIPRNMTKTELEEKPKLQEMIRYITFDILDEKNIQWMTEEEIIETYNKYSEPECLTKGDVGENTSIPTDS